MIVLLNGTSPELLAEVGAALRGLERPWPGGEPPEVHAGRHDGPESLRALRLELSARDPESYAFRLREPEHPDTPGQDVAAGRGDVGMVIDADGRDAAALAEEIADLLLEDVRLEEPGRDWSALFEAERALLEPALGGALLGLHHVGSTAVPGLPAKPILDLLAKIESLAGFPPLLVPLAGAGYCFLDYPENRDRRFLRKGRPRTHHLHVVAAGSQEARDQLDLRDALRADSALRAEYAELKRGLAARHGRARAAYGAGKSDFIARALRSLRVG